MGIRNMGISRVKEGVSDSSVSKSRDVFVYFCFSGSRRLCVLVQIN